MVARAVERMDGLQVRRVAAFDLPIANAKSLEDFILPSVQDITNAALSLVS
jgi:pyruvate/2-oxoglutarate/acetoin dehydrogenase E1 component